MNIIEILKIETRRNIGLLALPLLIIMGWFSANSVWARNPVDISPQWPDASVAISFSTVLIGPMLGGMAAWVASRGQRREVSELRNRLLAVTDPVFILDT